MSQDALTQAEADIDYLYARASAAMLPVSELDEDIFLELVGKQVSDGKKNLEARALAFANWAGMKGRR